MTAEQPLLELYQDDSLSQKGRNIVLQSLINEDDKRILNQLELSINKQEE